MRRAYLQVLVAELATRPPGVYHATIVHDDACTPSSCVCEPEIVLETATPENVAAGAEGERQWRERVCS